MMYAVGDRVYVCDDLRVARGHGRRRNSRVWTICGDDTGKTWLDSDGKTVRRPVCDPEPAYHLWAPSGARNGREPARPSKYGNPDLAEPWRAVAPGIAVPSAEYDERFGGIDLNSLRARMPGPVFEAYVRFLGAIPGAADVDVVEISRLPDD